jgi:predicted ATPase
MKIPPWYVITGGPCSGITTLVKRLHELGYYIVDEAARSMINGYKKYGISGKEARKDEGFFQICVQAMKLEREKLIPKDKIVFFDRGVPDSIAYEKLYGLDTKALEEISRDRYKGIFFLEQLPFKKDYARTEDEATAKKLNKLLLECYQDLGYQVVYIPITSVEERTKLVLSHLD